MHMLPEYNLSKEPFEQFYSIFSFKLSSSFYIRILPFAALVFQTAQQFLVFSFNFIPAVILSEQVEHFSHDGIRLLRHSHVHAGTFWG